MSKSMTNLYKAVCEIELFDKHTVHWFRKDLRFEDNPALRKGLEDASSFRCVYFISACAYGISLSENKWRFIIQSLIDLDNRLKKVKSRLYVIKGQPIDILPNLFIQWKTTCFTFEEDPEIYGEARDYTLAAICRNMGIKTISYPTHTLYNSDMVIMKNNAEIPITYNKFEAIIKGMGLPSLPESNIPDELFLNAMTPIMYNHDKLYGIPTMKELNFNFNDINFKAWVGGEIEGLARFALYKHHVTLNYERDRNSLRDYDIYLSPYIRFGCLSVRKVFYFFYELFKDLNYANAPMLYGQMLWREFFFCLSRRNYNFNKTFNNPLCLDIQWNTDVTLLSRWAHGTTGFPWIDAIMRQLREEGWIHNLSKNAVACFLTRGNLWLSWDFGMYIFKDLLLDAEWSYNAGMWIWLSGSCKSDHSLPYYCPVKFGRINDPNGDYIRKFVPELRNFPTAYIHEPWTASVAIQREANCIIGQNYPLPIINHTVTNQINDDRMKQIYKAHYLKFKRKILEKIT